MADEVTLPAVGRVKTEYVWAGIALVAGIAGYAWWKSRGTNTAAPSYVDPTASAATGSSTYTNPVPGNANGDGNTDQGSPVPTTDAEWTQLALNTVTWLEQGYLAGVLGAYLARQPLSTEDAATVRQVWGVIGKPPGNEPIILITSGGGSPGGTVTPPPPPPPPPPPAPGPPAPAPRQYVIVVKFTTHNPPWNSTLSGIAAHYHTTVGHLMSLNPDITNPNLIHVGQRVYVT